MRLIEYHKVDDDGNRMDVILLTSEDEVPPNHFLGWGNRPFFEPVYDFTLGDWVEGQDPAIALAAAKKEKDAELNAMTNESILSGFDHEIDGVMYHFSFDTEAQLNYQGAERILSKGTLPSIDFTVFKDGSYARVPIDLPKMETLIMAIMMHKNRNIVKYRELLLPLVEAATTVEEVKAISWDSI